MFSRLDPHENATMMSTFSGWANPGSYLPRYLFRVT
jgi:hypothetical protein